MSATDVQDGARTGEEYVARFCEHDGRVVECTIFPQGLDDADLMTTWISAATGSFVDLVSNR